MQLNYKAFNQWESGHSNPNITGICTKFPPCYLELSVGIDPPRSRMFMLYLGRDQNIPHVTYENIRKTVLLFPKTIEEKSAKASLLQDCYGLFGAKKKEEGDSKSFFLIRIQRVIRIKQRNSNLQEGEQEHQRDLYQFKFYNCIKKSLDDGVFEENDHSVVPFGFIDQIFYGRNDLIDDVHVESDDSNSDVSDDDKHKSKSRRF